MSSIKVAVVIPAYKDELDESEKISLAQARKVLGNYQFIFVAPEGKIFSYFKSGDIIVHYNPFFFKSIVNYNQLMLSSFFYEAFLSFDYILIYQLDAFVFYDALEYFCSLGYDYIGAPWPLMYRKLAKEKISAVGNGGFSLRNVKAHHNILLNFPNVLGFNEDTFFSYCGKREDCNFSVAPINVAYSFAAEFKPARVVKKNGGKLPFGCHDWHRRNAEFYTKIFLQLGYDLRLIKNLRPQSDEDFKNWLKHTASERLIRRLEHGQSVVQYLPTKCFASVWVIRFPLSVKLLARLLSEENFLADEIFIRNKKNWTQLFQKIDKKELPHLLLFFGDDAPLISAAEEKGLIYGVHFVSFWREYLTCCEKLFHNLGK